jgi:hypothetical protein
MGKTLFEILQGIDPEEKPDIPKDERPYLNECAALVACDGRGHGIIIQAKQYCALWWDMDQVGSVDLSDYGLDLAPKGISIWEGKGVWSPGGYECPQDGQMDFEGEFRRMTAEETAKVQAGDLVWPEEEDVDEDEGTEEQGDVPPMPDDLH